MKAVGNTHGAFWAAITIMSSIALMGSQAKQQPVVSSETSPREEIYLSGKPAPTSSSQNAVKDSVPAITTAVAAPASLEGLDGNAFEPVDVVSMTNQADLILVGKFEQVQGPRYLEVVHGMNNPNSSAAKMSRQELAAQMFLTIDCDRVLKGDKSLKGKRLKWIDPDWEKNIHSDTVNGVTYNRTFSGGIPQLTYGIFFLKKNKTGIEFVDPTHCVLPASPASIEEAPQPFTAVINELNNVLAMPLDFLNSKGGALGAESSSGPRGTYTTPPGEVLMRDTMTVLTQLPDEMAIDNLKTVLTKNNAPLTKLWAFNGLLSLRDWSSFPEVESYLLQPSSAISYAANYQFNNLEDEIQTAKRESILPTIPSLEIAKLLKSTDVNIRRSASFILAAKNDPKFLETLATTLSTDGDKVVRANCASGLEKMTEVVARLWEIEPQLAREISMNSTAILSFNQPMSSGCMFEQAKIAPLLDREFSKPEIARNQFPEWLSKALHRLDAQIDQGSSLRSRPYSRAASEAYLPAERQPQWSAEGSGDDSNTNRKFWYTYTKTYSPALTPTDDFTIRKTTICFMIQLKNNREPEITAINQLPPAKILDVWRQDDDVIFKRLPNGVVRVITVRRIYGANGSPQQVAPSGMHREARFTEIEPG